MPLTPGQRNFLRARAHHRKPVVTAGAAGLAPPVLKEIEHALAHHELIKIRLNTGDRARRAEMTEEICAHTGGEWVQNIGRIAVVYRPAKVPVIKLP